MFWCCGIALLAGLFLLWEKSISAQVGGRPGFDWQLITSLTNSAYGQRELESEVCLLFIALVILAWLRRERTPAPAERRARAGRIAGPLLLGLALLWLFLESLNSHASAFNVTSPTRVAAYALHVFGAGLWIGGQVALLILVAPRLRARGSQYAIARETYVEFGAIAALGVMILIVTGLYSAGQQVASLDALLLTQYGRAIILKTLLLLLTGLVGLSHAAQFHPKVQALLHRFVPNPIERLLFGTANPVSTLRLELLGGATILLLAAFLSSTSPARGPEFETPAPTSAAILPSVSSSSTVDDLLINFTIKPNRPGQNFVTVGVFDTRRPAPAPIEQVIVNLLPAGKKGGTQIDTALSDKNGTYQASTAAIDFSGDWQVSVLVKRSGMSDAIMTIPWAVGPDAPLSSRRPTLVSSRPLAPYVSGAALLLSILLGSIWLVVTFKPGLFRRPDKEGMSSP